jgi:hypothetical protein
MIGLQRQAFAVFMCQHPEAEVKIERVRVDWRIVLHWGAEVFVLSSQRRPGEPRYFQNLDSAFSQVRILSNSAFGVGPVTITVFDNGLST